MVWPSKGEGMRRSSSASITPAPSRSTTPRLQLPAGCICGLVGMNGAGKSTLFKALTGRSSASRGQHPHQRPSGGGGRSPASSRGLRASERGETTSRFPVSVRDVVMMGRYGAMNPLAPAPQRRSRRRARCPRVRVDSSEAARPADRQRSPVQPAQASLPGPGRSPNERVPILLDEPFNGVDVRTETASWLSCFCSFSEEGRTILIPPLHDLGHVREFCDLVVSDQQDRARLRRDIRKRSRQKIWR